MSNERTPDMGTTTITEPTIAFEGPGVTLWHGDCLDVMRAMPDESVHSIVTDPPYGLEFMGSSWDAPWKRGDDINADAGMSSTGYSDGGRRLDRPSFTGSTNPKCMQCGGTRRGRRDGTAKVAVCLCENGGRFPNVRAAEMRAFQDWCSEWTAEALRVLKPGGHLVAFGGSRTWHRLAVAVEDAGFEIRDSIAWLYAQGFPKSANIGADAQFCQCPTEGSSHAEPDPEHAVRAVLDADVQEAGRAESGEGSLLLEGMSEPGAPSAGRAQLPAAEDGRSQPGLEGWGDNAQEVGQLRAGPDGSLPGAVRVDAARERVRTTTPAGHGRVGGAPVVAVGVREPHRPRHVEQRPVEPRALPDESGSQARRGRAVCGGCGKPDLTGWGTALKPAFEPIVVGRKPLAGTVAATVLTHGTGALNIDACRVVTEDDLNGGAYAVKGGRSVSGALNPSGMNAVGATAHGEFVQPAGRWPTNVVLDESQAAALDVQSGTLTSGAMRAGTPRATRQGAALGVMPEATGAATYGDSGGASRFFPTFRYEAKAPSSERPEVDGVQHPTVKPVDLMRWLVRLVTPPGGTVLEPFAGSGTTLEAALAEGFDVIGVELTAEYLPLIRKRLTKPIDVAFDLGDFE